MLQQFRLSVCHTHGLHQKTLKISSELFHHLIGPSIILVCCHQGLLRRSQGFTPNGGAEYKGGSNFRPVCGYISETVIDRGIFTMEDEYEVICALSNSAAFNDLE